MPKPITPLIAADAIIELVDRPGRPIVLIERLNPPHGWAIPGGFVDVGERVEAAAMREAREETGLAATLRALLGVYSDPARDRGVTPSRPCMWPRPPEHPRPWTMPVLLGSSPWMRCPNRSAFDHATVLADYLAYRAAGTPAPLRFG